MRRISVFITIGAVLALLAIQPTAASANPRTAHGSHHHHAAARPHRKRHHTTSRHARKRHLKTTPGPAAKRRRAVRSEARKARRFRAQAAAATLHEQLLDQISVLELPGATDGNFAGDPLRPAIRLTSTAPWLTRSST
jgi:hypothetical protein